MEFLRNLLTLLNWREPFSKLKQEVDQMKLNIDKLNVSLARVVSEVGETVVEVAKLKELVGDNAEAQSAIDDIAGRLETLSDTLDGLQEKPQA